MAATRNNRGGKGSDTRGLTAPANQETLGGATALSSQARKSY